MTLRFITIVIFVLVITVDALEDILNNGSLSTQSVLGRSVLTSARRLDGEVDYSWMAKYSLKYQGCHHIKTWNTDAYYEDDVKVRTDRLVRFRLCPSNHCNNRGSTGCSKGYGDYVVDIDTYVSAHVEALRRQDEIKCENYVYKRCDCYDNDDNEEQEYCIYDCFKKGKKYSCIDNNPYVDDDDQHEGKNDLRDFEKYFEGCSEFKYDDRRRLGQGDDEDEEVKYYIGTYCADQGGKIYLGMFTDNSCTEFADKNAGRSTYKHLTGGETLPYSDRSMIRGDCIFCDNNKENKNGNNNDKNNDGEINKECREVYASAGKCETFLSSGPSFINEAACYFMQGIELIRKDGWVDTSFTRPNKVVSFFIFFFAVSFVLLGAYIYYLRMSKFSFRCSFWILNSMISPLLFILNRIRNADKSYSLIRSPREEFNHRTNYKVNTYSFRCSLVTTFVMSGKVTFKFN